MGAELILDKPKLTVTESQAVCAIKYSRYANERKSAFSGAGNEDGRINAKGQKDR